MAAIIVYFSRKGENYVSGTIKKLAVGNTEVVANILQKLTGAETFKMQPVQEYSKDYNECIAQAQADQRRNARPELKAYPESLDAYDTVYLGYPIWWSDMPMAVYSFLESCDFSGKTIIPFCTHEGSGISSTESSIAEVCPDTEVLEGLGIRGSIAQNSQDEAKETVDGWLEEIGTFGQE